MKRIANPIETEELCSYGCGNQAKYANGSGNLMCETRSTKCPAIKKKNSDGLVKAHKEGKMPVDPFGEKRAWKKGKRFAVFEYGGTGQHKSALIDERGHRCESCGLEEWLDQPITLELEHIDGDTKNNEKANLQLLCPNCHSQTPTWRRAKKAGKIVKKRTDEEIITAVQSSPNLRQALEKLELKWGSGGTVIDVMGKYNVTFASHT